MDAVDVRPIPWHCRLSSLQDHLHAHRHSLTRTHALATTQQAYLFPCRAKSAAAQVNGTLDGLAAGGAKFGTLWFDIETNPSPGCGWGSDYSANCQYMVDLTIAALNRGQRLGFYSSHYEWEAVVGSDCGLVRSRPLWFAEYDNNPSLSTFNDLPFGDFESVQMKQFTDAYNACGRAWDRDAYPA